MIFFLQLCPTGGCAQLEHPDPPTSEIIKDLELNRHSLNGFCWNKELECYQTYSSLLNTWGYVFLFTDGTLFETPQIGDQNAQEG